MGNKPSQIDAAKPKMPINDAIDTRKKVINGTINVSRMKEVGPKNDWFQSQNQAIGITEVPNPLVDQFEISWIIKDWSKVSQSANKIQFQEFIGGPLTNHLWSLSLEINKGQNVTVFLILKEINGSSDFVEYGCWLSLFANDQKKYPSKDIKYYKLNVGRYLKVIHTWPTQVENDSIRIHCNALVKVPFTPDLMKHTLMTSQTLPALTSSNEILIQDFGSLFQSKEYTDFKLVVGNVKIPAHKNILSARSPVFAKMLATRMKEKAESKVVIKDFEPKIVNAMLEYIYTGKTKVKEVSTEDLLLIAEKYQLPQLREECETVLIFELSILNAARCLKLAHMVDSVALKKRSIGFIKGNLEEVTKTEGYKELAKSSPELLTEILLWKN